MILFPALGTPAIIEPNGQLTVYLAMQKRAFDRHTKNNGASSPGAPVPIELASYFYFQTMITPWTDRGRDYVNYKKYSDELATEAAASKRFYTSFEKAHQMFKQKKFGGFYVGEFQKDQEFLAQYYPLEGDLKPQGPFGVIHKEAVNMYLDGQLTETEPKKAAEPPSAKDQEEPGVPPENLGYRYVFQFTVKDSPKLAHQGLYELMYLYINYAHYFKAIINRQKNDHWVLKKFGDIHDHYLTNPGDDLVSKVIINDLEVKTKQIKSESKIVNTFEFERWPYMEPEKMKLVKIYDSDPTLVMTQGQKNLAGKPDQDRGGGEKSLHYLSDKNGWFVLSKHPVYITEKNYLDLGVVSDLHLSSRQASYKLVAPQVIHGVMEQDSPYLGALCNQALETAQSLMKSIGQESDLLIVAGDAFDVLRNLDPKVVESKTLALRQAESQRAAANPDQVPSPEPPGPGDSGPSGSGSAQTPKAGQDPDKPPREIKLSTAELWEHLDFKKYEGQGPNYPFYIDALMFMALIFDYYTISKKPVFYLTGNHEAYEVPYGISPRPMFMNNNIIVFRPNAGIPSDQNLTFYEAALLFGKKYSFIGRIANFKKENLAWAYRWITPWKDCLVNSGKNQNMLLMGWDDDENYLLSALAGGDSLPRAGSAITDHQLSLLKRMTGQADKFNLMASHFTYANFDLESPLHRQDRLRSGSWILPLRKSDTGSFEENRTAVYSELTGGRVKLTISGHSHRGGAYTCSGAGQIDGLRLNGSAGAAGAGRSEGSEGSGDSGGLGGAEGDQGVSLTPSGRGLKSVNPQEQFPGSVACLVSGSAGLYSYQNLTNGELSDVDKPQGMIIKCGLSGELERVHYVRNENCPKPRLAVRCDYLWYENGIEMFYHGDEVKGDIVAEEKKKDLEPQYMFYLNPEWLRYLNNGKSEENQALPIAYFHLYCINRKNYETFSTKALALEIESDEPTYPLGKHRKVPAYKLTSGPQEVINVMGRRSLLGDFDEQTAILYFISVHFNESHPIGQHYDLKSPWCYPVNVTYDRKIITRKFGRDGELPLYSELKKIPEYNPTEGKE
ncbi:MAG: hypothetical protein LBE80_00755 [Deltaproteobacteria bacterium]|nr:hypothetical protein [Deltaproteobacteria bacterium]